MVSSVDVAGESRIVGDARHFEVRFDFAESLEGGMGRGKGQAFIIGAFTNYSFRFHYAAY